MIRLVNMDTGRGQLNTYSSIALFFNILVLSYYLTLGAVLAFYDLFLTPEE
jgi:hypothetical protein